jgi:hypothetical protein
MAVCSVASGVMMLVKLSKQRTLDYLKKQVDAVGHQVTTYQCHINTTNENTNNNSYVHHIDC